MGLFTNDDKAARASSEIAFISEGLSITGEINATDNVYINGSFKGRIVAKGEISIGPKGKVDGEILTKSLKVSGVLEGNIECESITIFPTGKVIGILCSETLEVHPGGYVFGENRLRKQPPAPTAAAASASVVVEEVTKTAHLSVVTTMPSPKEPDNASASVAAHGKKHVHSKNEQGARERSNTSSSITPTTAKAENNTWPHETVDRDQLEPAPLKEVSESRRWHSPWGRK